MIEKNYGNVLKSYSEREPATFFITSKNPGDTSIAVFIIFFISQEKAIHLEIII
jgi:hypothetical protein